MNVISFDLIHTTQRTTQLYNMIPPSMYSFTKCVPNQSIVHLYPLINPSSFLFFFHVTFPSSTPVKEISNVGYATNERVKYRGLRLCDLLTVRMLFLVSGSKKPLMRTKEYITTVPFKVISMCLNAAKLL